MQQRGFTLIEILVVLVIIAMLVSMASVNTGNDPRISQLINESQRLRFTLEDLSERAIFQNIDFGFIMSKSELTYYKRAEITPADPANPASKPVMGWKVYQDPQKRIKNPFKFSHDDMELSLEVNGLPKLLSYAKTKDDADDIESQLQFFAFSSGEQDVTKMTLFFEDLEFSTVVTGMGVGRYYSGVADE